LAAAYRKRALRFYSDNFRLSVTKLATASDSLSNMHAGPWEYSYATQKNLRGR
jgi:hypothetical protein